MKLENKSLNGQDNFSSTKTVITIYYAKGFVLKFNTKRTSINLF